MDWRVVDELLEESTANEGKSALHPRIRRPSGARKKNGAGLKSKTATQYAYTRQKIWMRRRTDAILAVRQQGTLSSGVILLCNNGNSQTLQNFELQGKSCNWQAQ